MWISGWLTMHWHCSTFLIGELGCNSLALLYSLGYHSFSLCFLVVYVKMYTTPAQGTCLPFDQLVCNNWTCSSLLYTPLSLANVKPLPEPKWPSISFSTITNLWPRMKMSHNPLCTRPVVLIFPLIIYWIGIAKGQTFAFLCRALDLKLWKFWKISSPRPIPLAVMRKGDLLQIMLPFSVK